MPPPLLTTSAEKSSRAKAGSWASALNSVLTAGNMWKRWPRSAPTSAFRSRGFGIRISRTPMRTPKKKDRVSAKM